MHPALSRKHFIEKVRHFENALLGHMDEIYCPVHLSLGHEGVAADIYECIEPQDWIFSTHRNHHHYLAKGGSEEDLWNEIMGSPDGVNGGFAGSQGVSDGRINFHASAIVGGLVGVAAGTAYALKMNKSDAIVVCCIGDGATEAGVFWESLNFAALHQLPICYICENNGMSVDSHISERQATPITQRVKAFGIEVRSTVQRAMRLAREGKPSFCEMFVTLEGQHIYLANLQKKIA